MATSYAKLLRENEELRERLNTRRSGNEIATATLPGRDRHNQGGQTMSRPERQTTGLKIKPQAGGNVSAPEDTLEGEAPIAATTPQKYISPYAERLEALYSELENSEFDYNKQEDPNWQAMRKEYLLAADRTADDVLAKASVNTGGRASSYAVTAASQAANDLRASFTQEEAALYDQAYNRYYQEYSKKLQDYENLLNQDELNYGRWMTEQQQAQEARDKAYDDLVTLIMHTGHTPSAEELAAADMSAEEAASWKRYYQTQLALAQSSGGGGGGGYSSGGAGSSGSSGGSGGSGISESVVIEVEEASKNGGIEAAWQAVNNASQSGAVEGNDQRAALYTYATMLNGGVDTTSWGEYARNTYNNLYRSQQNGWTAERILNNLKLHVKEGHLTQTEANRIYKALGYN